jgi:Ca2+-binding EF-hand superfamily protein
MQSTDSAVRRHICDRVVLRSQPAKLRKLFLSLPRDEKGRFTFASLRAALLRIGCVPAKLDLDDGRALRRVFAAAATSHGRLTWSDFAGRLLKTGGGGIQDGFERDGPMKGVSPREKHRLIGRAKNQKSIRAVGGAGFRKIFESTIRVRAFTQPTLEKLLRDHDTDSDGYLTTDELALAVRHLGIHDVCSSDFRAFADFAAPAHQGDGTRRISIAHLVDIGFAIPSEACKRRGNFYLGGGSRDHGRDRAVAPRGLHVAINLVRERIGALPGCGGRDGILRFFEQMDEDGDGEIELRELRQAFESRLKITSADMHPRDVRGLFNYLDSDSSQGICKNEFLAIFALSAGMDKASTLPPKAGKAGQKKKAGGLDAPPGKAGGSLGSNNRSNNNSNNNNDTGRASAGTGVLRMTPTEARNKLLAHVRDRVSLLCRRRGLKDLWVYKIAAGNRQGRLQRAQFKSGLRNLGCRGFGPGDSDLLFDLVKRAEALAGVQAPPEYVNFTAFSRVFSPDTFFAIEKHQKQMKVVNQGGEFPMGVLPQDPAHPTPRSPLLDTSTAPPKEYSTTYGVGPKKVAQMMREAAWNVARSDAMGSTATTNPDKLANIFRRFDSSGGSGSSSASLSLSDFKRAIRAPSSLSIRNVTDTDIENLFQEFAIKLCGAGGGGDNARIPVAALVKEIVPSGLNFPGKAAITYLFTDKIGGDGRLTATEIKAKLAKRGNQPRSMLPTYGIYSAEEPAHRGVPWGIDKPDDVQNATKNMQSNTGATISRLGGALQNDKDNELHVHVIHDRGHKDSGVFYDPGARDNRVFFTTKDDMGRGAAKAAMQYYREDGGVNQGKMKAPSDDTAVKRTQKRKPTGIGFLKFPGKSNATALSNSDATFGSTTREHWSEFRVSPRRRRKETVIRGDTPIQAPYAVTATDSRPESMTPPTTPTPLAVIASGVQEKVAASLPIAPTIVPTRPATENGSAATASGTFPKDTPAPSPLEKRLTGFLNKSKENGNKGDARARRKAAPPLNFQKNNVRYYPKLCDTSTSIHSNALRAARMKLSSRGMGSRPRSRAAGRSRSRLGGTRKSTTNQRGSQGNMTRRAFVPARARQGGGAMPFQGVFFRS